MVVPAQTPCTGLIVSPKLGVGKTAVVQVTRFLGQWEMSASALPGDLYELGKP